MKANESIRNYIVSSIATGTPAVVKVAFNGADKVDYTLPYIGTLRSPTFELTPDYKNHESLQQAQTAVSDLWSGVLSLIDNMTYVGFEKVVDNYQYVEVAKAVAAQMAATIKARPYVSTHFVEREGISIRVQLSFVP